MSDELEMMADRAMAPVRTAASPAHAKAILEVCGVPALIAERDRYKAIVDAHDLCHDLHGKVDAKAFATGCAAEQRKIYGCAPDADERDKLRAALEALPKTADGVPIVLGANLIAHVRVNDMPPAYANIPCGFITMHEGEDAGGVVRDGNGNEYDADYDRCYSTLAAALAPAVTIAPARA